MASQWRTAHEWLGQPKFFGDEPSCMRCCHRFAVRAIRLRCGEEPDCPRGRVERSIGRASKRLLPVGHHRWDPRRWRRDGCNVIEVGGDTKPRRRSAQWDPHRCHVVSRSKCCLYLLRPRCCFKPARQQPSACWACSDSRVAVACGMFAFGRRDHVVTGSRRTSSNVPSSEVGATSAGRRAVEIVVMIVARR